MAQHTPTTDERASPTAVTRLILRVFRANGELLQAGDRLVEPLELTSARWQILGAIAEADQPQPVAAMARQIGVSRQAVQRIANELVKVGLVAYSENPRHKRAQLVQFTDHGRSLFEKAMLIHQPWVAKLASNFAAEQIDVALRVLDTLVELLEADQNKAERSRADRVNALRP